MSKAQQSKSKSAYRGYIGYTAKVIALFAGHQITDDVEMQNSINEMRIMLADAETEIFDGVLFSRTANIDLWKTRFQERTDYALDKVRELLERQLHTQDDEAEKQFRAAAAAFGTDVDTYAQFLQWNVAQVISKSAGMSERGTAYTHLGDVLKVYAKLSFAIEYVRFDGRYYHVKVTDSGRRRSASRRTRKRSTRKKKARV